MNDSLTRVAFFLQVRSEKVEEYKEHHSNVWPEMLEALSDAGWRNYSLFMREDGLLFGYFETPYSFEAALEKMASKSVNTRWQQLMAPYFVHGDHPDQMMVQLEEVFHLD